MKRRYIPLLLLPVLALGACSGEIMAKPGDYDDPLVVDKGSDILGSNVANNIHSIIYDAKLDSGSVAKEVLNEVLFQLAVSIYGDYAELTKIYNLLPEISELENTGSTNGEIDTFINNHKVYWTLDVDGNRLTDAAARNKEYLRVKLVKERIDERVKKEFYNEISGGSYTRNGYFYETDYLMSLRNTIKNVADPFDPTNETAIHDKYLIVPELDEESIFDYKWNEEGKIDGIITLSLYENAEKGYNYVSDKFIPEIYRDLLVEQYLFDSNYSTIGRAYAREVNIITINNRADYPLIADSLMNSYIDNYINTDDAELAKNASFDIITSAWRGLDIENDPVVDGTLNQQAAYLLKDAGSQYSTYVDSEGFTGATYNYWTGTSNGDMVEDLKKVVKNPLITDSTIENEFTNNGEYTVSQGVRVKENEIRQESYVTDGWYIRNGGLSSLNETIRTRLFNIGVANALDDAEYPDRFADNGTYSIPDGENSYVAKIHGRYFLKPVTTERNDDADYTQVENRLKDMLWIDQASGSFTIVEITEAVSSSKLALFNENNYENVYNGIDGFIKMENIAHEVAYQIAQNDSYRTLSTQYWLEAAALAYHDDTILDYFETNYPDLFEK